MGTKHNLMEMAFARDVVKEFPAIKKELEKTQKMLYDHSHFAAIQHSIQAINESLEMIDMQLSYYKLVLDRKAKE